jgi:bifunctional non-homologous end joining protein LigD
MQLLGGKIAPTRSQLSTTRDRKRAQPVYFNDPPALRYVMTMALDEYRHKRDFRRTPEPSGTARALSRGKAALSFVIQKHAARRLHYDFRLEFDGVLKSWAIPKGPSLDPHEKRLAVEVEDHPIEYGGFEGVIPQGEYGGGTVLLWDRGTWEPLEPDPQKSFADGMIKFSLHGAKLHGDWMLVRLKRRPRDKSDNWLLIKERDDAAIPGSGSAVVDELAESVASHRTIDDIAVERDRVWHSKNAETPGEEPPPEPAKLRPASRIKGARKAAMPPSLKPQLATAAATAPESDEWLHEIKYDGYRLIARIDDGVVRLITRGGLDWTDKFRALAARLARLPVKSAIVDGELVSLKPDGTTSFADLQDAISRGRTETLTFFAFDLLYRDGWDLTGATLDARKAALAEIIAPDAGGMLRYSDHHEGQGPQFLKQAATYGIEGIVAKRRDRPYEPGRGRNWLKIKVRNRDEFIIVGFSDPDGSREGFGALLLGYYDPGGELRYAGRVGSGFRAAQLRQLRQLHQRLSELAVKKAPVTLPVGERRKDIHWVRPELVVEVEYAVWTTDKLIRQSTFQGLREDKPPREVAYDPGSLPTTTSPPADRPAPARSAAAAQPTERLRDGSIVFNGVRLSHPDRALYADTGLTKQDVAQYYVDVAQWALPHLAGRPLTIIRSTGGKGQRAFYQKHVGAGMPSEIKGVPIRTSEGEESFPVIEDVSGLIALVQVGVVEIHPWGSSITDVERPDWVTFDLDPDEGLDWARVTEAAIEVRDALDAIGLRSFVKTSGGKGLHVVVPLAPKLDWDAVKTFSKWVADRLAEERPAAFTANPIKKQRRGRIYLDYLRNSRGATAAGAYSPRERPGTTVSTPLAWDEVEPGVKPTAFTVATVPGRLKALDADPWAEIGDVRQEVSARVRKHIGI